MAILKISDHASLLRAVDLLGKYAPEKKPLLSAMPEVEGEELLGAEGLDEMLSLAGEIIAADERIRRIGSEESRERAVIESLVPWLGLDLPLDVDGTERSSVLLGSIPVKVPLDKVREAIEAVTEESELFEVSADKKASYVMIVCAKEALGEIQEALRAFDFTAQSFTGMSAPAKTCSARCQSVLEKLAKEKAACEASIVEKAEKRDELKLAADRMEAQLAMAEAADLSLSTDDVALMQGWVPAEKEAALEEILSRYDCAWECEDPPEEDYPEVPVSLKNNKLTNALNMVTDMYSLPAYGTVDPNPLMAPFFILFYGLMMADIGYGLIMIAAALVALKKLKPRGGSLAFCQLLLYGGIATAAMGVALRRHRHGGDGRAHRRLLQRHPLSARPSVQPQEHLAGSVASLQPRDRQRARALRLDGAGHAASEHRHGRQRRAEGQKRRQGRRDLGRGLAVGHPRRRAAARHRHDAGEKQRAAHRRARGAHHRRRDAALRRGTQRQGLRQGDGGLRRDLQHRDRLVRRRAELFAYHGADARRRRRRQGLQHRRDHARAVGRRECAHDARLRDHFRAGTYDELRAEPAGLLRS